MVGVLSGHVIAQEETDEDPEWSAALSVRAQSRLTQYGLDVAPEQMTFVAAGSASHRSGVGIDASAAMQPGSGKLERFLLSGGYELTLAESWSVGISLDHAWYPVGSINPLASSPTSGSLSLDFNNEAWSMGIGYDRYFGGAGASYFSADVSGFLSFDGFSVLPLASVSFGSQKVTTTALKSAKSKKLVSTALTTIVTGLSSVNAMVVFLVPLGDGWSCSAMPGVSYTPSDLASSTTRFTWSLGLKRSF